MAEYKVIALNVTGLRNKVHYLREVVTDDHFPQGRASELVKKGFIAPIEKEAPKPARKTARKRRTKKQ